MKIAVIADPINNQNAGVHIYTKHLVDELIRQKENHEIIIVCEKRIDNLNCRQIVIPNTRFPIGFASLRLFILVPLALIREKVDVVIEPAHFGPWNLPGRIKRVTVIHDMTPFLFPQHHRWHSQLLQRVFLKRILTKTDLIVTNSDNTSKDVIDIFPEVQNKVRRIYLGVDPRYIPTTKRELIDQLPIDTSTGFFHYVGTLEPRKGLDTLIKAYDDFRNKFDKNIPLIICGAKGWKTEAIFDAHNASEYKSDIHFLGYVQQDLIIQLHSHSAAMIYPSMYEGFGFPVLEALSCGGKVITCNNSSLTEVGGDHCVYAETNNPQSLTRAMLHIMQASKVSEAQKKIQWAGQFKWSTHVKELIEYVKIGSSQKA